MHGRFLWLHRLPFAGILWLMSWLNGGAAAQSQSAPQLSAFIIGVKPPQALPLRLQQFTANGFVPVDSVRLTTDGALTLQGREARAGLYLLALDRYSRTEIVLAPSETPHFAATVAQLARQGVYLENSPENTAYYDILNLVLHYDTLVSQVHEQLAAVPDTSRAASSAAQHLERLHRNLNLQLRQRTGRHPQTFAATVIAPLALLPERPAAEAGTGGYLRWLRQHYLDTFSFTTDRALRHYLGASRVRYFLNVLWPHDRHTAADMLLARREGHDELNTWLYQLLIGEAVRLDDDALARHLRLDYPPDACAPVLPPALSDQLLAMAELAEGQPLPDLTVPDSTGRLVNLREVAATARLTAVVAWVSWCHTCERELPRLAQTYQDLKAKGLEVVTLSVDEQRAPWLAALRRQRPPWPYHLAELVPLAQSQTVRKLHVRQTPKLLLIDQAGQLVGRYATVAELAAAAETYLNSTGHQAAPAAGTAYPLRIKMR